MPFTVGVGQDPRKSDVYTVLIGQAGLGMPDRDYYLRSDEKFLAIRNAYTGYIARLFELAQRPDPAGAAGRVLALETTLAKAQWDRARSRDRDATYNKRTRAELQSAMPNFDWNERTSRKSAPPPASRMSIVRQPDYLTAVDAALAATPIATWKDYLAFGMLTRVRRGAVLTHSSTAHFEFNGKVIGGRQEMQPRWKRAVSAVEEALGEPVGKLYVERYFKPEAKARMDALIQQPARGVQGRD